MPARAKPARTYSARYKAGILAEYESLDREGKGALLRREGLYSSLISLWRKQRDRGGLKALAQPTGRPPADPVERDNQFLRRRVAKLDGELDRFMRAHAHGENRLPLDHPASRSSPVRRTRPVLAPAAAAHPIPLTPLCLSP